MKGLKKLALVSAIAAVSAGAQAELVAMDESALSATTGQAGITIDIEAQVSVGEIAYQDGTGGFIGIEDVRIGGTSYTDTGVAGALDNVRLTIDVADGTEALQHGSSAFNLYNQVIGGGSWTEVANADDAYVGKDGDLVIHIGSVNPLDGTKYDAATGAPTAAGTYDAGGNLVDNSFATVIEDFKNAVDFGMEVGAVKLRPSTYANNIGEKGDVAGQTSTTLVSDIAIEANVGPVDIIIQNNGDGFDAATGLADSAILFNAYFEVTNMDMTVDIAGVTLTGMKIHNNRGESGIQQFDNDAFLADGVTANPNFGGLKNKTNAAGNNIETFGFAHAEGSIRADRIVERTKLVASDFAAGPVEGISMALAFSGDMDMENINFGAGAAGTNIGSVYMTDIVVDASMTISAH